MSLSVSMSVFVSVSLTGFVPLSVSVIFGVIVINALFTLLYVVMGI